MNLTFTAIGNWSKSTDQYSEQQISSVIQELGIDLIGETDAVFLCLCPFHRNTDTPSFAVNKENGTYICFSPACDVHGNLLSLISKITKLGFYPAKRMIDRYRDTNANLAYAVQDIFDKKQELAPFDINIINRMADSFWNSPAHNYMRNRGFNDETLAHFQIGYSINKGLVAVPVHDWNGIPVGVIGRTIEGKRFENSKELPTRKTLFNANRAKKHGEKVIVVEASFDAMLIHQAGFPNVVATCGGFFTDAHQQLLNRYFNEIIIMTDNDNPDEHTSAYCKKCENTCTGHNPGRALGIKIADKMRNKRVRWASYDYGIIYPHNAKDPGDMTEQERAQCITNSISAAEMELWKKDFKELSRI